MSSGRIPMTPRGYRLIQERLDHLKKVERPENVAEIETARAHGDLSENAEYTYAKNRQGELEGEIKRLESWIALSQVIDPAKLNHTHIVFGATVELVDLDTDEELTYMIVGENEADIKRGLLNVNTPIARGLIGKSESDEVTIPTPGGSRRFEILSVRYTAELPQAAAE